MTASPKPVESIADITARMREVASPATANRAAVTVRIRPELKAALERAVSSAGMEVGTGTRLLLELFASHLATNDGDFLDAINRVKVALTRVRVPAGRG